MRRGDLNRNTDTMARRAMTGKASLRANLKRIARQWEDDVLMLTDIARIHKASPHSVTDILRDYFGHVRYAAISLQHRKDRCFAKGIKYEKGNRSYLLRRVSSGNPASPIGTIRVWRGKGSSGPRRYLKVKHGHSSECWRPVSQLIWERLHGPIPPGHFVSYRDGNTLNDEPENLVLVNRAENARTAVQRCDNRRRIEKIKASKARKRYERVRIRKVLVLDEEAA